MSSEQTIREIRLGKVDKLRELGFDPYLVERYTQTHSVTELIDGFDSLREKHVSIAGRIQNIRVMGKAAFVEVSSGDAKIQAYIRKNDVGDALWEVFGLLDIGDHIGVQGKLDLTRTEEKTIFATEFLPLSKALQTVPFPQQKDGQEWYGLTNKDVRYRHRHLDLATNRQARNMLLTRSKIVKAVRDYLDSLGYLEVECPMLQIEAGGAAATPFLSHYNAYDTDVKLRISLELYLKRIICGDVPKVYELGRVFRNEGVDDNHNPEFTLLEFYEAYINLEDVMEIVEGLCKYVCQTVFGSTVIETNGQTIDFGQKWARVDMMDEIEKASGITKAELSSLEAAQKALSRVGLTTKKAGQLGGIIEKLLEVYVEPKLVQPTFVVNYPLETSPLAKKDPNNPGFTRRFEGYVLGGELCNAFSEINDPIDQRSRFELQAGMKAAGDDEAHPFDEEFLYALECGMPPTGGCGIGIDRLVKILTGASNLREILMFPFMRPTEGHHEDEQEADEVTDAAPSGV